MASYTSRHIQLYHRLEANIITGSSWNQHGTESARSALSFSVACRKCSLLSTTFLFVARTRTLTRMHVVDPEVLAYQPSYLVGS